MKKDKIKYTKYYCEECGSSDVEEKYWCKINTGEIIDVDDSSEVWCCQCEGETTIVER